LYSTHSLTYFQQYIITLLLLFVLHCRPPTLVAGKLYALYLLYNIISRRDIQSLITLDGVHIIITHTRTTDTWRWLYIHTHTLHNIIHSNLDGCRGENRNAASFLFFILLLYYYIIAFISVVPFVRRPSRSTLLQFEKSVVVVVVVVVIIKISTRPRWRWPAAFPGAYVFNRCIILLYTYVWDFYFSSFWSPPTPPIITQTYLPLRQF